MGGNKRSSEWKIHPFFDEKNKAWKVQIECPGAGYLMDTGKAQVKMGDGYLFDGESTVWDFVPTGDRSFYLKSYRDYYMYIKDWAWQVAHMRDSWDSWSEFQFPNCYPKIEVKPQPPLPDKMPEAPNLTWPDVEANMPENPTLSWPDADATTQRTSTTQEGEAMSDAMSDGPNFLVMLVLFSTLGMVAQA